jgi:hypothetical protein
MPRRQARGEPPGGAPVEAAPKKENSMNLHLTIGPLIALIAGILILVMPRLLNFIVAIYLIAIGVLGLLGNVKF